MSLHSSHPPQLTELISLTSSRSTHLIHVCSYIYFFIFRCPSLLFSFPFSVLNLCLIKLLTRGVIRSHNSDFNFEHQALSGRTSRGDTATVYINGKAPLGRHAMRFLLVLKRCKKFNAHPTKHQVKTNGTCHEEQERHVGPCNAW